MGAKLGLTFREEHSVRLFENKVGLEDRRFKKAA
jgi:hypothetical protein